MYLMMTFLQGCGMILTTKRSLNKLASGKNSIRKRGGFMIIIGEYKEFSPNMEFPSIKDSLCDAPYENKDKILEYLKSGNVYMVTASKVIDAFTGEITNYELIYMDDGQFSWSSKIPYYVEKYNLKLPVEFEQHIISKS